MKFLLALDLADPELQLELTFARALPWVIRAGGVLDTVYCHQRQMPPFPHDLPVEVVDGLKAAWGRLDEGLTRRLAAALQAVPAPYRGTAHVAHGPAATALPQAAAGYDVLMLASHGRAGLARVWAGSVSENVAAKLSTPVLVLRGDQRVPSVEGPLRMILALDLAEPTEPQLAALAPQVTRFGPARADALYAQLPPIWPIGLEPTALSQRLGEDWEQLRLAHLTQLLRALTTHVDAASAGDAIVRTGDPAHEILSLAENNYDLVILGTHQRTGLAAWWNGSVADRVLRRSPVPVLVVPGGY